MGDRTTVELWFLTKHKAQVDKLADFEPDYELGGEYEPLIGVDLTGYQYFDINYAQLRWEKALQDAKIPYDKSFDSGMEFLAGCEYHRVGKGGKSTVTELCDAHIGMVAISDVEKAFKDGTLEQFLEAEQDKQPMEWHQQAAILSD